MSIFIYNLKGLSRPILVVADNEDQAEALLKTSSHYKDEEIISNQEIEKEEAFEIYGEFNTNQVGVIWLRITDENRNTKLF